MDENNKSEKLLQSVDSNRRGFFKRLLGASFAVPVIATFTIEALTADSAFALIPNTAICPNNFDEDLFLTFFDEKAPCVTAAPPPLPGD